MKSVLAFLLAACVVACSVPGPREPDRYFVLDAGMAADAKPRSRVALDVAPTTASSFYDTQDMVYSRAPGVRAYFQFNRWTERPQRSIHAQLASRFEGGAAKSGLRLNTHLDEIYHDVSEQPGMARITVAAELVDTANRTVLARRTFTRAAPAASYDAPGAVRGFNQSLAALIGDIEAWVDAEARSK
ncbi:MAG: membrane integrity-associated transporter subunit PqiC [Betaproteobacteria bacterium]|nr:membrane integrity-associated transporter subunit PqiC [Betaproteobacteria bacterium]